MVPLEFWAGFIIIVIIFLFLDLFVFHKKDQEVSIKEALIWTGVWFGLAMIFNIWVGMQFGIEFGVQFLTGYLIEKSLSVDNLFVILAIFAAFKIAPQYQHKILFWGILGAIVMRGIMIGAGAVVITHFEWVLYIFGVFLIYTGIKFLIKKDDNFDPHESFIVRSIRRFIHVSKKHDAGHFFVKENGKLGFTILFVVLLIVEFTDVAFAFDSIPAIFAISTEPFIVFTSNIFAILGLRSLFFVLAHMHNVFHYLNVGLAIILMFIGTKMLIEPWVHINIVTSLVIVIGVLTLSMVASLVHKKRTIL